MRSLSPNNENSSESGSESTSPESSSEESNNGSAKVDTVPTENKNWCLSSFVPKNPSTKSTQPSQDSQPNATNIKHEPHVIDDDNDLIYPSQIMQNSMNPLKDLYQQQTLTNNYDVKLNNCDLVVDSIKQEPPGKCSFILFNLEFFFALFLFWFFFGVIQPKILSRFFLVAAKSPSKSPEKLPSVDPFESDEIESVLAEAKELNQIKPVSSLSGE